MKTLEELMDIVPEQFRKFYNFNDPKWTEDKKKKFVELANKLYDAGAVNPVSWASSEVNENIPQFGRFLVLKNLFDIFRNTELALEDAVMYGDDVEEKTEKIKSILGEESLNDFLQAYGRAIITSVIDLFDEGNRNMEEDGVSWYLSETDGDGEPTGRIIEALHEDAEEFNEEG